MLRRYFGATWIMVGDWGHGGDNVDGEVCLFQTFALGRRFL